MIITTVQGDLLDTDLTYIAHGVNCQNRFGSGVAHAISVKYPEVKKQYHEYCKEWRGYSALLGRVHKVQTSGPHIVYNLFTQDHYGYDGAKYVSYDAIDECFAKLNRILVGKKLAIPKIGCGLAGGNWEIVWRIIDDVTPDLDVYVYCKDKGN